MLIHSSFPYMNYTNMDTISTIFSKKIELKSDNIKRYKCIKALTIRFLKN